MSLDNLPDAQLVEIFKNTSSQHERDRVVEILWQRHTGLVWRARVYKPEGYPGGAKGFCEDVRGYFAEKLNEKLSQYDGRGAVEGFLWTMAKTAALDVMRKYLPDSDPATMFLKPQDRSKSPKKRKGRKDNAPVEESENETSDKGDEAKPPSKSFRKELQYRIHIHIPSPLEALEKKEEGDRLRIAPAALNIIASWPGSEKDHMKWYKRATTVRMVHMEQKTRKQVADFFKWEGSGEPVTERTVSRWLEEGEDALLTILRKQFGIHDLTDI